MVTWYQSCASAVNGFPATPGWMLLPTMPTGCCGLEFDGETQAVNIGAVGSIEQLVRRNSMPADEPLSAAYRAAWLKRLCPDDESSLCTLRTVSAPSPRRAVIAMRVTARAAPRWRSRVTPVGRDGAAPPARRPPHR